MSPSKQFDSSVLRAWADAYGGIPADYTAFDVESTGIRPDDKIVQLGWCAVRDRKATITGAAVINWEADPSTSRVWLEERLYATKLRMEEKGKQYPWTPALLRQRGHHPRQAVMQFAAAAGDTPLSSHYGWMFDFPRAGQLYESLGLAFDYNQEQLLDTGLLIKACLVGARPKPNEPLKTYYHRVAKIRTAPAHNLEACASLFDLRKSGVVTKAAHEASYDSWLVHLLTEKLREQLESKST